MSDDKTLTRPQDSSRVNVNEDYELRYWCEQFGCSEAQLREAVDAVGVSADKLRDYFKGKR